MLFLPCYVQVSAEPTDDAIKRTLDHLHDRAKGATYFTATELDTVRPMLELIWAPLLGCFSVLFDEYSDPRLLTICLNGFSAAACLAAELGVSNLRDIFINSLCNFTHLHSPGTMKPKNGLAFKYLLRVAQQVGDHLEERWVWQQLDRPKAQDRRNMHYFGLNTLITYRTVQHIH